MDLRDGSGWGNRLGRARGESSSRLLLREGLPYIYELIWNINKEAAITSLH